MPFLLLGDHIMLDGVSVTRKLKIKSLMASGETNSEVITARLGLSARSIGTVEEYMVLYARDPMVLQQGRVGRARKERAELRAEGLAEFDAETAELLIKAKKVPAEEG